MPYCMFFILELSFSHGHLTFPVAFRSIWTRSCGLSPVTLIPPRRRHLPRQAIEMLFEITLVKFHSFFHLLEKGIFFHQRHKLYNFFHLRLFTNSCFTSSIVTPAISINTNE